MSTERRGDSYYVARFRWVGACNANALHATNATNRRGLMTSMISRRNWLTTTASGFGYLAFSALTSAADGKSADKPLAPRSPHFPARARRVIFLCMEGGPAHMD